MKFRICLFLASLSLASRALRVWGSAIALGVSAVALRLSKRLGPPPVPLTSPTCPPKPGEGVMTVQELLSMAERFPSRHFVLRLNGVLIEITQVDEVLEAAVFDAPSEGQPWPRGQRPFFLSRRRATHDKVT